MHDYVPDFLIQLESGSNRYLILETKGFDPLKEIKEAAANRWCAAVNALGAFGTWEYQLAEKTSAVRQLLDQATQE
jgi:type III restriction enzyme